MQIVTALTLLKPLLSQECAWQLQKRLFKDGYSKLPSLLQGSRVELHPLAHAQFVSWAAYRDESGCVR